MSSQDLHVSFFFTENWLQTVLHIWLMSTSWWLFQSGIFNSLHGWNSCSDPCLLQSQCSSIFCDEKWNFSNQKPLVWSCCSRFVEYLHWLSLLTWVVMIFKVLHRISLLLFSVDMSTPASDLLQIMISKQTH